MHQNGNDASTTKNVKKSWSYLHAPASPTMRRIDAPLAPQRAVQDGTGRYAKPRPVFCGRSCHFGVLHSHTPPSTRSPLRPPSTHRVQPRPQIVPTTNPPNNTHNTSHINLPPISHLSSVTLLFAARPPLSPLHTRCQITTPRHSNLPPVPHHRRYDFARTIGTSQNPISCSSWLAAHSAPSTSQLTIRCTTPTRRVNHPIRRHVFLVPDNGYLDIQLLQHDRPRILRRGC